LLDLASDFGVAVDLHTDEQLGADVLSIEPYAAEVEKRGIAGAVASHCVSLGSLDPEKLSAVIGDIKRAGLGIVGLPITNLYLQGRDQQSRTPRGVTALRALIAAGVPVAAGGDNLRDPFNPMGRADPFETTSLLVTAAHLEIEQALDAVTGGARQILSLNSAGPVVGARADLLAVPASSLADLTAGPGDARIVLFRGRLVSRTNVTGEHAISTGRDE
jgi:cytosine deaminase